MAAALDGIKVLDLSRILAGPWCTMTLADLGAEVWKIENPDGGDDTRTWMPPSVQGISTYYLSVNRSKKSVAIDLKTAGGRAILTELATKADVFIENFRPASLKALGLSYESLSARNPRLIHCAISGYGRSTAFADRVGYDQQYRRFCRDVLAREELCTDERFRTNAGRTRHRDVLVPELAAAIKRFDTRTLIAKLHANGIPGGELRTVAEAFASEEAKARDAIMVAPDPQLGEVRMVRSPLRMSGSPTTTPVAPPTLRQHTREVLGGVLGYSAERIDELEQEGAIRCGEEST